MFQRQPDIAGPLFDADQLSLDAHRADLPFQKECTDGLAAILRRRETQREGAQQQGQQPPIQRPVQKKAKQESATQPRPADP